jgi:hypothetical protein
LVSRIWMVMTSLLGKSFAARVIMVRQKTDLDQCFN